MLNKGQKAKFMYGGISDMIAGIGEGGTFPLPYKACGGGSEPTPTTGTRNGKKANLAGFG